MRYKQNVIELKKSIDDLISLKYEAALEKLSCTIKQLGQVKSIYKNVIRVLGENDYKDLSKKTEARIVELEKELDAKQKYESSIVECNKDISFYSDASLFTYSQAVLAKSKMEHWEQFFKNASDLPEAILKALMDDIHKTIDNCDKRISELLVLVEKSADAFEKLSSVSCAQEVLNKLESLLEYELPEEKNTIIRQRIEDIRSAVNYLQTIPEKIDELQELIKEKEKDNHTSIQRMILSEIVEKREQLLTMQKRWVDLFIVSIEENVETLNAPLCIKWINDTKDLPGYLDSTTLARYQKAYKKVEKQLQNCRINGVVSMYLELTPVEKEEFVRIINGL